MYTLANSNDKVLAMVSNIQAIASRIAQETAEEMAHDAVKYAVEKNKSGINSILDSEYHKASSGWYGAYSPSKYIRKYSIHNLMEMEENSGYDIGWIFSDEKMTKSSKGGSLFGPVFHGGSHGLRHRTFIPTVTTAVPTLFKAGVKENIGQIVSLIQPQIDEYYNTHFNSIYNANFWRSFKI